MTRDADGLFDTIVIAVRPLVEAHGFRETSANDAWQRSVTFRAGDEALRVAWDADYVAFTVEALEPEFGGSWADIALRRVHPATADDAQITEMIETFREALSDYFASLQC